MHHSGVGGRIVIFIQFWKNRLNELVQNINELFEFILAIRQERILRILPWGSRFPYAEAKKTYSVVQYLVHTCEYMKSVQQKGDFLHWIDNNHDTLSPGHHKLFDSCSDYNRRFFLPWRRTSKVSILIGKMGSSGKEERALQW